MNNFDQIYIGGAWVRSASSTIPVINPATEAVIAAVPAGTAEDADRSVNAARHAFESWSVTPPAVRTKYLSVVGDALPRASTNSPS
jgi:aldehyde dehydrogenase (NAD+)